MFKAFRSVLFLGDGLSGTSVFFFLGLGVWKAGPQTINRKFKTSSNRPAGAWVWNGAVNSRGPDQDFFARANRGSIP